ncbi:MAG: mechanosensitive ion channel [Bacteroidales bacterium]|nr:mechanosensitive ion channel [Bacteroidales bacterium]
MKLNEILDYTLWKTDKFSLTVNHLLIVLLTLIVTKVVTEIIKRIFRRQSKKRNIEIGRYHAIIQLFKYILWTFAILIILDTIGVKITILLAGSAALLVGIGLGLQQLFQDFVSGIVLLFEGSLKIGDVVELQDGVIGKVKEIGIRTSKIESRNNIIVIVPNSKFIGDNVINWSHIEKRTRFDVGVGVAYGSDVELVKKLLLECAKEIHEISKIPAPFVRFEDFGDSSLDFKLYFWTSNTFYVENVKSDIRFAINRKFRENNVQIPFPQRDVHLKK